MCLIIFLKKVKGVFDITAHDLLDNNIMQLLTPKI